MKTDLELSHLSIVPGRQGRVDIDVTNTADVIDGVTAIVDGINPDWIHLERPLISLFPDASDKLGLVFDIPATCPAGDYLVIVRIVSTIEADRQTVHDFWLSVTPVPALELTLSPSIVSGGSEATMRATIVNTGNTTASVFVDALEPTREIDCTVEPSSLLIPQNGSATVDVLLRGKRSWFGDPVSRSITISAKVGDLLVEKKGTFRQKPKIPRGLVTALILAGIVVLWALIFWFVISELRRTEPAAKAPGTDLLEGPENIPLARVAGTIEGTVRASTTGNGIPRITVEARRLNADDELVAVGSAATDDDGNYSLKSLIPGTYLIRFSADGFTPLWYGQNPGEPENQAAATEVAVDPQKMISGLDVSLTGEFGVLSGSVALPPDGPEVLLTVTATQIVERSGVGGGPGGEPATATTETIDGTFLLGPLPTPSTYVITVTGDGFQTQQFEQTLSRGGTSIVNTVELGAASGVIEGTVRDSGGRLLGGVAVTARSGDVEIRSITPTSGNTGEFRLIGLPTPRTYALTFELPGFSSTTESIDLDAGSSSGQLSVVLVGGNGTISGSAVGPDGVALGGITVTIRGTDFTSETTTLTTNGAGGLAGSFSVTDLPIVPSPANYTVTLSNAAFQTETVGVTFTAPGPQTVGAVQLLPITSEVRGVVSGPSGGLGEVTVTLSDGDRPRETISATNPAGVFAFANVPPGSYTLTFERAQYVTRVVLVQVPAGINVVKDTTLVAKS
jgi:hypothetical protein